MPWSSVLLIDESESNFLREVGYHMNIQELKKVMADAGDVGAGGAGFPSSIKLSEGADTLIINAAECEPLLYTDYFLMKKHMDRVLKGAEVLMEAAGIKKGFLGVKKHTAERLGLRHQQQLSEHVQVYALPDVYPMGDEIILIYEVLRRIVTPGALPITAGVLVFNVETLYNVQQAVDNGYPVAEKWMTVGGKVKEPYVLRVPVGTPIAQILKRLHITVPDDCVMINGGPAMGNIIDPETAVVTKTTKGVLILPKELPIIAGKMSSRQVVLSRASSACCQCTLCTEMCPRALIGYPLEPHKAVRSVTHHVEENPQDYVTASLCSGCGVCELAACCQGLSPRRVYQEMKGVLAKNGLRYQHQGAPVKASPERDYRLLPIERFKSRIGVSAYDRVPALDDSKWLPTFIKLPMRQHVGAPATPCVQVGDMVKKGDVVGQAGKGVSSAIHSSMDGKVLAVDEQSVTIGQ